MTWEREAAGNGTGGSVDGGESKPYTVYNLTVEDDHTYFVGTVGGGTWVHNACYTKLSDSHVYDHGHAAEAPYQEGQSQFYPGEGGQKFTDEVVNHPDVDEAIQDDDRIRYTVEDLGRRPVGLGEGGLPARGGRVIVEGNPPLNSAANPGDVVTQFPF